MKKLMILMSVLICSLFLANLSVYALADGEEIDSNAVVDSSASVSGEEEESVEEVASSAVVEDSATTNTITAEEIKAIVDTALNEQQRSMLDKVSAKFADALGINGTLVYVILAGVVIGVFVLIVLIGKIVAISKSKLTTAEKLKACQALLDEKAKESNELITALQNGNKDKVSEIVTEHIKPEIESISDKVTADVVSKLKFDSQTQSKMLASTINNARTLAKIVDALRALAIKSNNKELANALSTHVEDEEYERVLMENQKLKVALGEQKVEEVLSDEK